MFIIIAIALWVIAYTFKQNPSTNNKSLIQMLFVLGFLLFSVNTYMLYQSDMVQNYYNGGTGITFRDVRWNSTTNTTYNVDSTIYSLTDTKIGEWSAWETANQESIPYLSSIMGAVVVLIFAYGFIMALKYTKLIR